MSVWVAATSPNSLPINLLDYSTLAILHQFTSKYWSVTWFNFSIWQFQYIDNQLHHSEVKLFSPEIRTLTVKFTTRQITTYRRYTELADHLSVNSVTYQHCQGLSPGQCIMVAPAANMNHPIHSSSNCYPCTIVPPKPFKFKQILQWNFSRVKS